MEIKELQQISLNAQAFYAQYYQSELMHQFTDKFIECIGAAAISYYLEEISNHLGDIKNTLDRIAPKE